MKSSRQDGKVLILVSAYSCHEGGGKTLLIDLLDALNIHGNGICYIDTRLELNKSYPNIKFRKFRPKLISRLQAEYLIYKEKKTNDILLCFGNLPPLIKSNSNTYIFLQNRFLIDKTISIKSNLKTFIRLFIERIWFKCRKSDQYTYIVQTPSMSAELLKVFNSSLSKTYFVGVSPSHAASISKEEAITIKTLGRYSFCIIENIIKLNLILALFCKQIYRRKYSPGIISPEK